jgi:hypothetical protein
LTIFLGLYPWTTVNRAREKGREERKKGRKGKERVGDEGCRNGRREGIV